jgi:hypothetical protein
MLLGASAAAAEAPWQLRETLTVPQARTTSPAAVAAVRVDLALDALHADSTTISLPLTDGTRITALRQASQARAGNDYRWLGHVGADPEQQVLITRVGDHMTAYLSLRDAVYELTPTPQGPLLLELDSERFPPCGGAIPVASMHDGLDLVATVSPSGGPNLIDVLIVFSPAATTQVGGQAAALAFAQGAVDSANLAFDNSMMLAEFRLAGVRFTTRADSGSGSTDLGWLRNDPEVAGWRNQVGADLVGMISEFGGSCGVGFLMGNPPGAGFAPAGFQVTARNCAIGNLTYAHEHGHNMGFQHDPANGSGAAFPYAYGHFVDGSFRTVMSYSTQCVGGCTRRPYFSNPGVNFQGAATGIADQRDNARAGNQTAPIVAAFRVATGVLFANGFE